MVHTQVEENAVGRGRKTQKGNFKESQSLGNLALKKKNLNINLSDKDRFKNRMKVLRLFFCATSPFFLSRKNFTFTVKQNFD